MVSYAQRNEIFTAEVNIDYRFNEIIIKIFRLFEMPSFKLANSWYDQSYSEVLNYKDADCDANTLQRYCIIILSDCVVI